MTSTAATGDLTALRGLVAQNLQLADKFKKWQRFDDSIIQGLQFAGVDINNFLSLVTVSVAGVKSWVSGFVWTKINAADAGVGRTSTEGITLFVTRSFAEVLGRSLG